MRNFCNYLPPVWTFDVAELRVESFFKLFERHFVAYNLVVHGYMRRGGLFFYTVGLISMDNRTPSTVRVVLVSVKKNRVTFGVTSSVNHV